MFVLTRRGQFFRGRGVTHACSRVGPISILVPIEGESPFAFMGAFIPNTSCPVDVFFIVYIFDDVIFFRKAKVTRLLDAW